ncbi:hypothetical protein [Dietzia alimentaria]|uniref:hypothetical protein n=1 Tax=Dietzia alimentaria TaxID=665550 RepID=UPI00029B27BC|nr:hypothetical protein [Dietzia alimentaria]
MARTWHPSARFAALGMAAAFVAAAAPTVNAQIPGNNPRTTVYPVDSTQIQLDIEPVDLAAGTVRVVVQNNTDTNLNCTGIDGGPAATVTTAEVVARSIDYFTQYPLSELADLTLNLPSQAGGAQQISLGSAQVQAGSAAEFLNPEWDALNQNDAALEQARLAGHYGVVGTNISIQANQAFERTVRLDHPSSGQRADFQTGVFMTCTVDGQRYAFHAYEGGVKPNYGTNDSTGSLGSAGLGS